MKELKEGLKMNKLKSRGTNLKQMKVKELNPHKEISTGTKKKKHELIFSWIGPI